ncbi:MAG: zinc ribbon domain-containing protein [Desulfobacteraceae bacterium]|jgi:hypothetical protein
MNKFCHSCSAPLNVPEFKGPAENYCVYCTDSKGALKSENEVKMGIAQWLKSWQPKLSDENAAIRAEKIMQAMPAWAD